MYVGVANAARMHFHQDLIRSGLRLRNVFDLPRTADSGNGCSFYKCRFWLGDCSNILMHNGGAKRRRKSLPINSRLTESLNRVQAEDFLADGEITDSQFYLWDLLRVDDSDLRI